MSQNRWYFKLNMTVVSLLLGLLLTATVWISEVRSARADAKQVEEHARVISRSLWNLDEHGPVDYLHIAMRLHTYDHLTVFSVSDPTPFIDLKNGQHSPLDRFLLQTRLIHQKMLTAPIYHQQEVIGQLRVLHTNKRIYRYLNWFIVACLVWVGMKFFLQMIQGKQLLETRVVERTNELQASKRNLSVTLDAIGDGVIATDLQGRVVRMNPVASHITGWPQCEAIGRPFSDIFPSISAGFTDHSLDFMSRVFNAGKSIELVSDSKINSLNGNQYLISLSGAPIRTSESGEVMGVVFVVRDTTESFALQERLRQSEKMRAIGQLAGGIAHDFNNMLGGIMGAGELLRETLPSTPASDKYLDMLERSAKTAAGLADKLLVFARQKAASDEPVNLHDVIDDTVSLLQSTIDRRIRVDKELTSKKGLVRGDQSLLQSALLNMGINASRAIKESGSITYRTAKIALTAQTCALKRLQLEPGPYIEIAIADTGCGIDPDVLPHIFEPFFTTRLQGQGTGLGLAAVEATIQQHGGAVTVSSVPGQGTTFQIYLPQAHESAREEIGPALDYRGAAEMILLVDDEEVVRRATGALLENLGYQVMTAGNGREGLDQFKQHADDIDLVILDMIMPEMNGRDCLEELQKIRPDVRVILSSGFSMEEDIESMKNNGLLHILKKPFQKEALAKVVYRSLHG